ncbi:MAG: hypothetical protein R6V10_01885, partial [bacterium]
MEKSAKHVSPLLWVFSIIFVFFIKPLFLNVSFQDPANFHYDLMWGIPTLVNIVSSFYDTAHTPFWYIHQNMGVPIAGWYLPAIFHPLVLLFGGFKVGTTTALLSFFNMELLALFSFLVFRRAGASEWGSAAAALLAAISGFIPWLNAVYEIANALPWIMCWLWTCMEINDRPRLSFFAGNAVAVFFLLISGDAQLVVLSAYLLPAWLLLYVLKARYPIKTIARSLAILCAAAAAAWIMSSCQIIPALLFFDKAVTTRTPELAEYLNTYPRVHEILLAGGGLFTR